MSEKLINTGPTQTDVSGTQSVFEGLAESGARFAGATYTDNGWNIAAIVNGVKRFFRIGHDDAAAIAIGTLQSGSPNVTDESPRR